MTKLAIDKVKLNDNFFVDDCRRRVNLSIKVIKNWIKITKCQKQNGFAAILAWKLLHALWIFFCENCSEMLFWRENCYHIFSNWLNVRLISLILCVKIIVLFFCLKINSLDFGVKIVIFWIFWHENCYSFGRKNCYFLFFGVKIGAKVVCLDF